MIIICAVVMIAVFIKAGFDLGKKSDATKEEEQ
jgi:hypothetical protein